MFHDVKGSIGSIVIETIKKSRMKPAVCVGTGDRKVESIHIKKVYHVVYYSNDPSCLENFFY